MSLAASANGTLVLDERGSSAGNGTLRYSEIIDGVRQNPKPFGKEINTGKWNAHPYIAPDESYILWDGEREDGFGSNDLFVSFRNKDGTWSEAINLGDKVNTEAEEGGPHITPDGKYLIFKNQLPRFSKSSDKK
jgi:Tol biopolymer transport system component